MMSRERKECTIANAICKFPIPSHPFLISVTKIKPNIAPLEVSSYEFVHLFPCYAARPLRYVQTPYQMLLSSCVGITKPNTENNPYIANLNQSRRYHVRFP